MKHLMVSMVACGLLFGCSEEYKPRAEDQAEAEKLKAKEEQDKREAEARREEAEQQAAAAPADAAPEAKPDPTDPKELAEARNVAILEERFDDALRLCGKEDHTKIGEQAVFACVLTACRKNDAEKAAKWAANVKGKLKKEAQKVCTAQGIALP